MKRDRLKLKMLNKELSDRMNVKPEVSPEEYFTSWIISVSKFMGYRINQMETLMSEFLEMAKQMNKEISKQPTKQQARSMK